MLNKKNQLTLITGWFCLLFGVLMYIFPIFYTLLGHQSGLVAFVLIFIGISLLKYRKDQVNK
jgi:amino acid transporter